MAQAIVFQVPNLVQAVADSTAGTLTIQYYDSTTSSWVTAVTTSLQDGLQSLALGLSVTGNSQLGNATGNTVKTYNNTLDDGSGNTTIAGVLVADQAVNPDTAVTSFAGTTAGTVYWVMPFQGSGYKKVLVYLDGYENDTATAQTITYPTAFVQTPNIYNPAGVAGVSTTTTELSIDPDNTTAYTGWIVVEGY